MTLGLVRHFKVNMPEKKFFYDSSGFRKALDIYDSSPVKANGVDLGENEWEMCFASSLPRAEYTARSIFSGDIVVTDLIREVPMAPFTDSGIILPSFVWHLGARIAWYGNNESQPETRTETYRRVNEFAGLIGQSGKSRILIVSHGFFMRVLAQYLSERGYMGKIDERPRNGKLYMYTNN